MSNTIASLKQSALSKKAEYEKLLAQGEDLSSTELSRAAQLATELKELRTKIEVHADHEDIKGWLHDERPFDHKPLDPEGVEVDAQGRVKSEVKGLTNNQLNAICSRQYASAFDEYTRKGRDGMSQTAYKTLQEGSDGAGGFLVPEQIQLELIQKRPGVTGLTDRVRKLQTSRDSLSVPRVNWTTDDIYTSGVRMTKTGEIPAAATTADVTDPTFGMSRIEVYTHMANATITRDMIEDSLFDMSSYLGEQFRQATTLMTEDYILNGTGVGQPVGIATNPGGTIGGQQMPGSINLGVDGSNNLTPDGLVRLAYSLPAQYDTPEACWVFNKTNTARGLFGLKDQQDRYLFGLGYQDSGLAGAKPKELLGYQYVYSSLMPNAYTTTGASGNLNSYPIIFGDLTGYWMVERAPLSIQVLTEVKATLNQVQLVGRWRFGGAPVEDWKIKVGKVAANS